MEEKEIFEMYEIDTNGNLKKEIDVFENIAKALYKNGSSEVEIKKNQLKRIERKTIVIENTGNFLKLKDNIINIPLELIIFPFFTNQKNKREVNFEYRFKDLGIVMYSTLISKSKEDLVLQPSSLEKKIFDFLVLKHENNIENGIDSEYIQFELSEFVINFLSNKMNRVYYTKIEQALKNLKSTEYEFLINNHKKAGNLQFETPSFKLLNYQKIKVGKKVYYQIKIHENIIKKIEEKRYIKMDTQKLIEIENFDSVAARIYQFISMKRFSKTQDEERLEVFAGIIPLKTFQITKKQDKDGVIREYKVSIMKKVLARVLKAFDILVELKYIKKYEVWDNQEEKSYKIVYTFNEKKDGECHKSDYLIPINAKNPEIVSSMTEKLRKEIEYTKRNIYFSKKYTKSTEKKILDLVKEEGEEIIIKLLKSIYSGLKTEIKKSLNSYMDTVLKELKKESLKQENRITIESDYNNSEKEKLNSENIKEINEAEEIKKQDMITQMLLKLYKDLPSEKKEEIDNRALELFKKDVGD
ncbi:chromosomal replication initiator DnaA, partial [Candidatus Gracilibacteria bacterium]|nr:chromosomal replication initiator DnaA [Candidatus Gracilibacteria bacterium]